MTNKGRKKKTVCWPAELNKWQSTELNCVWWHHINLSIRAWAPFFSCVFISVFWVCVQTNISCSLVGIICCVSHSHNRRVQMLNLRREFLLTANIFIIVSSFWHCSEWGIFFFFRKFPNKIKSDLGPLYIDHNISFIKGGHKNISLRLRLIISRKLFCAAFTACFESGWLKPGSTAKWCISNNDWTSVTCI